MHRKVKQFLQIRGMKYAIEILLIVMVFLAVKTYTQRDLVKGTPPHVEGKLLNGVSVNLENLEGSPLLLHFWATWCPICKLEQDSINAISKDYKVLGIAMNSGTDIEVGKYLEENNLSFPTLVDKEGEIAKKFGVRGVPVSFIIGPDGNIAFIEKGFTTEYGLRFRLWLSSLQL